MNKFKKLNGVLIVFIIALLIGCTTNDDNVSNGFNLENQIYIYYKNADEQNLLETSTQDSYKMEDMKLFYLVDNEPIEVTIENGFKMGSLELTPDNALKIFTNPSSAKVVQEKADFKVVENVAYLKLSETDTDTIKTYSQASENYFRITKIWYNDDLVWTNESDGIIEITK